MSLHADALVAQWQCLPSCSAPVWDRSPSGTISGRRMGFPPNNIFAGEYLQLHTLGCAIKGQGDVYLSATCNLFV